MVSCEDKHISAILPSNPKSRYLPKRNKNMNNYAHHNFIHNRPNGKQSKCLISRTDKQIVVYSYLVIERNSLLTYATLWVKLKNMICKRSQTQEYFCIIPFIKVLVSIYSEEIRTVFAFGIGVPLYTNSV